MFKKKIVPLLTAASVAMLGGTPAAAEDKRLLKPTINGSEFTIDCGRDFRNAQPTIAFLDRLDRHFHDGRDGTITYLLETPEERSQRFGVHPTLVVLAKEYDRASDKVAFLTDLLEEQHSIGAGFYDQVDSRCDALQLAQHP